MKHKKRIFAKVMSGLGLVRAASWLPRRPQLTVFNYHRIGSQEHNLYDDAVFSASPEVFRSQMLFLRKHFHLPPPDEIVNSLSNGFALKRPTALITFDDCYRDNFESAFPVLKELGVSAVFFIPTAFVEHPRLPWWDAIAYIVKHSNVKVLELDFPKRISFDLQENSKKYVAKSVLDLYKKSREQDEAKFICHLMERAAVTVPEHSTLLRWIVTWDEIREMVAHGMLIGSHTHTHGILSGMDAATQLKELQESKQIIERETKQVVTTLAYPVGSRNAFTSTTKRLAREAGYKLAFSFSGGINYSGHFDPFDVRRIGVEIDEPVSLFRTRAIFSSIFGKRL